MPDINKYDPKKYIIIKGARVNNLKNVDVIIPRNKFVVITGVSGSGKSSLAYDTLYAEGQRRYVESISSYARQFLSKMKKPDVDYIKGISPAIAIKQKNISQNSRSTVGTSTEIYEYIKLLYARTGKTYSPISGNIVKKRTVSDVTDYILSLNDNTKIIIYSPLIVISKRTLNQQLNMFLQQGYSRILLNKKIVRIDQIIDHIKEENVSDSFLIIDRLTVRHNDEEFNSRIADSVQTAFFEGQGECIIESFEDNSSQPNKREKFSNKFELDGIKFEEPSVSLFSFNNPYGACPTCNGFGNVIGIDEDLVVPNRNLSVFENAISCWKGEKMSKWKDYLINNVSEFDFPIHKPFYELTDKEKELLWTGNKYFYGLNTFFEFIKKKSYKIQYRVMLYRYRGKTLCPDCKGKRLRKEANYIKINDKLITELVSMPVTKLFYFFENINLNALDKTIAKRLLTEITTRLRFLIDVGLGYLTLSRMSSSLSGGETQRMNLTTSLGSNLVDSIYILDEPTIGLHPRDTKRLIKILLQLRDLGNTVIVVEHDENVIKSADYLIDIGPLAGINGGQIIFQGSYKDILQKHNSLTAEYLNRQRQISVPEQRKIWNKFIEIKGAKENNLKDINVKFPLNIITVVTGVSGVGKTSLVKKILYTALKKRYDGSGEKSGKFCNLDGYINDISNIELVDQNPIGKSSRSNPATYIKAYDDIRTLFSQQQLSRIRGYKPGYFSLNVPGGRCEECKGQGFVKIEMLFMADVYLVCENCKGKRFKSELLDVKYKDKNINDVLKLTVNQAIDFFSSYKTNKNYKYSSLEKKIVNKLKSLQDVGLGYLCLGQSSSTLSGGEAQRIKLAYFISKGKTKDNTLFIFDEPTTGLHFHDINKLYQSFKVLINNRHTIIIVEHNMDIIKCADWIIDLGYDGGENGGYVVFEGTPEQIINCKDSQTGFFLKDKLALKKL